MVPEIRALFEVAAVVSTLPDGIVQLEHSGIVGSGQTIAAARLDWGRQFAQMLARPKIPAT